MKKILFYVENNWAFGSIHHALCKELYNYGFYCNVLDWSQNYSTDEMNFLNNIYDIFVTLPNTASTLLNYGIPGEKIIIVAHEQTDIYITKQQFGIDFFKQFLKFGGISEILKEVSIKENINKNMLLVKYGVHFNDFYRPIKTSLKIVGYGGAKYSNNYFGIDRKRGFLVEKIVNETEGVEFLEHKFYRYMCMPSYYENIDCLMVSSLEDAGGLPAMEAAAAGRLVMSTPVGYFKNNSSLGAGILLPFDEEEYLKQGKYFLEYYRDNNSLYMDKCEEIQQFAREHYDWSKTIHTWINLLT
jgi:glycosyltransferase involved in cell wall biosynthesis